MSSTGRSSWSGGASSGSSRSMCTRSVVFRWPSGRSTRRRSVRPLVWKRVPTVSPVDLIWISLPVWGFRPVRAALFEMLKVPKPTRAILSPFLRAEEVELTKPSRARLASAFDRPELEAIASISSALFMAWAGAVPMSRTVDRTMAEKPIPFLMTCSFGDRIDRPRSPRPRDPLPRVTTPQGLGGSPVPPRIEAHHRSCDSLTRGKCQVPGWACAWRCGLKSRLRISSRRAGAPGRRPAPSAGRR